MALCRQIVDLVGLGLLQQPDQVGAVGEVAVMQMEAHPGVVRVAIEVVHPLGVEGRRAPLDAVDGIALMQQQLGEIGAVLSSDAGDQRGLVQGHEKRDPPVR
jgi:hypothetical protein